MIATTPTIGELNKHEELLLPQGNKVIMNTAERASAFSESDNYIFSRSLFAYLLAQQYIKEDVVELGCGEGYAIPMIARKASRYIAIDKYYPSRMAPSFPDNVEFIKMKMPPLNFIPFNSYNVCICFQTIEHITEDDLFIREVHRILKPGGHLILTTPNKSMSLTRNPWHVREYSADLLYKLLKKQFNKIEINGVKGDAMVKKYYEQNKKSVDKIKKYDYLNLENKLPATLMRIPYDILNRFNRISLAKQAHLQFSPSNFHISDDLNNCLDLLAIARKS